MKAVGFGALAILAMSAGLGMSAGAARAADPPHPLLDAALRCRAVTDDQARLRCFDAAITPIEAGIAGRSIVMVERRQVQRSFFGLSVPRFLRGGDEEDEQQEVRQLDGIVQSASHTGYQLWRVVLREGGTWQTIENSSRQELPRAGATVRIERGPVGNYWLSVNGRRAIRAQRVQ